MNTQGSKIIFKVVFVSLFSCDFTRGTFSSGWSCYNCPNLISQSPRDVKIRQCKGIWNFAPIQQGCWKTEKIMFCFVFALYLTENKFVDNDQYSFAFSHSSQLKPKFKCWQHLANTFTHKIYLWIVGRL